MDNREFEVEGGRAIGGALGQSIAYCLPEVDPVVNFRFVAYGVTQGKNALNNECTSDGRHGAER